MYKFICKECGKDQYSSSKEKEKESCIYCNGKVKIEENYD